SSVHHQIPIRSAHDDACAKGLQNPGAFVMVAMAMADEDIFDLTRIHPQLLDAVDDLRLDRVMEKRIDHDEAGARLDHPRVPAVVADPIEIVEDLARLLIPLGTWRHDFLARSRGCRGQPVDAAGAPATRGCVATGRRNDADAREK